MSRSDDVYAYVASHKGLGLTASEIMRGMGVSEITYGPRVRTVLKALTESGRLRRRNLSADGRIVRRANYVYEVQS